MSRSSAHQSGGACPRHGAPVRALVPGHWGEINVKWITEIEVTDEYCEEHDLPDDERSRLRELALAVGGFAGAAVILYPLAASPWSIGLVLAPAIVAALGCAPHWRIGSVYALVIVIGSDTLIGIRDHLGFGWLVWIILIVVATDVAGYFAGKAMGGPKFWPAVSPKKTWSGTVAGWIAAGFVGAVFGLGSGVMGLVVLLSLLLSFAGQLGDIAESAIKRRSGVKDSSRLIPGHGGVLDRFDALLGASLVLLVVAALTGFPPGLV